MISKITCEELADLADSLPSGELKAWCESSSAGTPATIVYADSGMLSRCREAAATQGESEAPSEIESNDEDIQGQPEPELDVPANTRKNSRNRKNNRN